MCSKEEVVERVMKISHRPDPPRPHLEILHPQQIQDHVVREPELALELRGFAREQTLQRGLVGDAVFSETRDQDSARGIQTSPP